MMERLLRVREVASILGVNRNTIYNWIHDGKLKYVLLPTGRIRIPESEVKRLFESVNRKEEGGAGVVTKN